MDIKIIDNFISPEDIQAIRSYISANEHDTTKFVHALIPGRYRVTAHIPEKHTVEQHQEIIPVIKKYGQKFLDEARSFFNDDRDLYFASFFLAKMGISTKLGEHNDNHEGAEHLYYSSVIYLNEDYEGGEIYFSQFDFKYKPKAGSMVIFRSPYLHSIEPITSGIREAVPMWLTLEESKRIFSDL